MRSIYDAARHHKLLVLFTCVVTLGLVTLYIYVWPPIYRAQALIMAEPDYDYQRDTFYTGWDIFRKDGAQTELELITAGPVLYEVVKREQLTFEDVYHPFPSQVTYFWEKSWVGRNYRAVKKRLFPVDEEDALSPEDFEMARTVVDLRAGLDMSAVGEANVGRLKVKGPSRRVSRIANTLMEVYLEHRTQRHETEAQRSYDALREERSQAGKEVQKLSDRRVAFAEKHRLAFDFQKESLEVSKLTELEATIASSEMKIALAEASLRETEKQLELEPPTKTVSMVFELNALREATKMKSLELQTALILAKSRFREDSPEVQEIKRDLEKLDALAAESSEKVEKATTEGLNIVRQELLSRRNALRSELEGVRAALVVMEETAAKLRTRLAEVPAMQDMLQTLDRDLAVATDRYKQLLVKEGEAAVALRTTTATMSSIRIIEHAMPPASKSWPKPKLLYPLGMVVGLMLGVGAALLTSYANGRILREHVEHGRGAVPFYGTVVLSTESRPFAVAPRDPNAAISPSRQN